MPYQAGIEGGFTPGKRLFVSGVPDKKAKRFEVNLMSNGSDIAFHVSIRFDEKVSWYLVPGPLGSARYSRELWSPLSIRDVLFAKIKDSLFFSARRSQQFSSRQLASGRKGRQIPAGEGRGVRFDHRQRAVRIPSKCNS